MEHIKNFVENVFKNLPQTDEVKRIKSEMYSNMEEKYHELIKQGKPENEVIGIVISEFGNIDELLEEINAKKNVNLEKGSNEKKYSIMNIDEIREYINFNNQSYLFIALGVGVLIFGVAVCVLLIQVFGNGLVFKSMEYDSRIMLAVVALFIFMVPAIGIIVYFGSKLSKYQYIDDGKFELSSNTKSVLHNELDDVLKKRNLSNVVGVCMCVFSPVSIFVAYIFNINALYGVFALLSIISVAVFIFIIGNTRAVLYNKLLKRGEYSDEYKKKNAVVDAVAGVVFPMAAFIFLITGLVYDLWHINWIIFPIVAVLYGGFHTIYKNLKEK